MQEELSDISFRWLHHPKVAILPLESPLGGIHMIDCQGYATWGAHEETIKRDKNMHRLACTLKFMHHIYTYIYIYIEPHARKQPSQAVIDFTSFLS